MSHVPSTFMSSFCHSMDPNLDWYTFCVTWFFHAIKHCAKLMKTSTHRRPLFWRAMAGYIFEDNPTELIVQHPLRFHPSHLGLRDCVFLYQDIVDDYVQNAQRFSAEPALSTILWQIFHNLTVFTFAGCMLFGAKKLYKKHGFKKLLQPNIMDSQICEERVTSRTVFMTNENVSPMTVLPLVQPEVIQNADGRAVTAVQVKSKFEFLNSIVTASVASKSRLYRLHDPYEKLKTDYKLQSVKNVSKFVGNASKQLRVVIIFEDEPLADDIAEKKDGGGDFSGNSTASSSTDSPRITNKRSLTKSNRAVSPRKQATTSPKSSPRSGTSQAAGLPHNTGRRSPSNKK